MPSDKGEADARVTRYAMQSFQVLCESFPDGPDREKLIADLTAAVPQPLWAPREAQAALDVIRKTLPNQLREVMAKVDEHANCNEPSCDTLKILVNRAAHNLASVLPAGITRNHALNTIPNEVPEHNLTHIRQTVALNRSLAAADEYAERYEEEQLDAPFMHGLVSFDLVLQVITGFVLGCFLVTLVRFIVRGASFLDNWFPIMTAVAVPIRYKLQRIGESINREQKERYKAFISNNLIGLLSGLLVVCLTAEPVGSWTELLLLYHQRLLLVALTIGLILTRKDRTERLTPWREAWYFIGFYGYALFLSALACAATNFSPFTLALLPALHLGMCWAFARRNP